MPRTKPVSANLPLQRVDYPKRRLLLLASLGTTAIIATVLVVTHAAGNPLGGTKLYADPVHNPAAEQATAWRTSRPTDAAQMDKIAVQPKAFWVGDWTTSPQQTVADYTGRAAASGAVGVLVAYDIPGRDCGNYSAGGAATADAYRSWTASVAAGIGGRKTVVILEPDALGLLTNCLTAAQQSERLSLLSNAVNAYSAAGALVYIDASTWIAPDEMARRLTSAGIARAAGFADNVSGYDASDTVLAHNVQVSQALGGATHFVIDSSRNGLGPAGAEWCNPAGRALGTAPTVATGVSLYDAALWIKYPGESDGTCNGGPSAGSWWPDYALGLAQRSALPVVTSTPAPPLPTVVPTATTPLAAGTYNDAQFTYSPGWLGGGATAGSGVVVNKYLADDHYTDVANSTYTVVFKGAQAAVYASKDASHGIAAYNVDNGPETLVDEYALNRQDQTLLYRTPALSLGTHTLKVRVTGSKNPASTGAFINADRLDITATPVPVATATPVPATTPTPVPTATIAPKATGDINGDGSINLLDLSQLLSHWGTTDIPSDLNHDGTVNILDLSTLLGHF